MNKKTLWGSVAGGALALGLAGGGTFAGWSDFNVQEEAIQAGHLTLNVGDTNVSDEPLRLAPGDNLFKHFYIASNDGDSVPDGNLTVKLENFVHGERGCENNGEAAAEGGVDLSDPAADCNEAGDQGELADETNIQWRFQIVSEGTDCATLNYGSAAAVGASGALRGYDNAAAPTSLGVLEPGQGACVSMAVNAVDRTNSVHINEIQGDRVDFDIRFTLSQV